MLNKIIDFSLNNKLSVLLGAAILMVAGLHITSRMDVDVFPDLTAPTVVVITDTKGMAAEESERLVTFPIEAAVNGAADVRRVRSRSSQGSSFVWIEFNWGADIMKARQVIGEKLVALSGALPDGITPVLAPQSSIMGEILFIGLQADSMSMMQLRTMADWYVKPALMGVGGVSQVTIIGGDVRQYQVCPNPHKMAYYGVTDAALVEVCRTFSDNASGGVIRDFGNEYSLRGIARTNDIDELGRTCIKLAGTTPVMVSDVAEISVVAAPKTGYATQNARYAIIISVAKQPDVNTLELTRRIEQRLEELTASLPPGVHIDTGIFRQADFIEASVNNVGRALLEGAVCVVIVLFLFLASFRTTVISVIAIPLSLLGAVIVLHFMKLNINTMTLGGMCIAIGSLVDDAIIDVENVYKRLKQNILKPPSERRPSIVVVYEASVEIRASVLNATFIIIATFMPLFFLSGMEGRMLKPLGIAYIVALFMSLIVAMTVTPLLCRMLLSQEDYLARQGRKRLLSERLSAEYRRSLQFVLHHGRIALGGFIVLFIIALALFCRMGQSFLPEFNEGALTISLVARPGISLHETDAIGMMAEKELLDVPAVESTARRTGRGELDEHAQSANSAEIEVKLNSKDFKIEETLAEIRRRLSAIPGVALNIGQPVGHRIDHILSGTRANIAIKVFGSDLGRLYVLGNQIKTAINGVVGLVDVNVEQQIETPQIQVKANRNMLAQYGAGIAQFNSFITQLVEGENISEIYEGDKRFDLVLRRLSDPNLESLRTALFVTDNHLLVPLGEIADIQSVGGPNTISRENVQRLLVISANVAGVDVKQAADEIKRLINSNITLPEGYSIEYGGQFESAAAASRTLLAMSLLAVGIVFLLLYGEFKSVPLAGIILLNLPLSLIGGLFAVFFTSNVISIPSIIGFITLFGVATRNGILLISRYEQLYKAQVPLGEILLRGSADRLNPILMTALTAALALLPLVIIGDKPGNEIQSPMALVVLGGLITSTILNSYIIPVVYGDYRKAHGK
ncbi:MAG: CusA/CzcA family heavy metal efflux RND transporter [Bacteroidales bacterium]|nr:CusA/CzcA family heavy metal efflux RND transporter [Bacteroidales bacterium]